jgi:hypothetical protein
MSSADRIATMIKIKQLDLFKRRRDLTYSQVAELFDRYRVWSFIDDAYEGLHVQGAYATYDDIEHYLSQHEAGHAA